MLRCYSGNTADIIWLRAMEDLLLEQGDFQDSRLGKMLEFPHASFEIDDPRQRWVVSRRPSMNPAFAIAEVFAILGGSNCAGFLNFWNPALPKYAGNSSEYYGAYGFRLNKHFQFNQVERAYDALRNNPSSRQVVLQIWDPKFDFPLQDGVPRSADIPCNICSLLKVRNGKLEWLQIMRGNDLYRGTPYNFVQFTTLQEIIAGWLDLEMGSYCQISDSLHLYESDLGEIDRTCLIENRMNLLNSDDLRLSKKDWDQVFWDAFNSMELMSDQALTINQFNKIISKGSLPKSYANLIFVAAADCARRHGWIDEMDESISLCDNKLLVEVWDQWKKRKTV